MQLIKVTGINLAILLMIFSSTYSIANAGLNAQEWLSKIDEAESVESSYAVVQQTITTSSGDERVLEAISWTAQGGEVSIMSYTSPARVKGDKILMRDDGENIWYYMKRRDYSRHFTGNLRRQSAMGSDFSYEDMAGGDLEEKYHAKLLGSEKLNGEECIKLELTPTEDGPSYDHLILWASQNDFLSRKIEYYDDEGHLKTLQLSNFQTIDGRITPMKMEMVNSRENSRTIMEYKKIAFDVEPEEWIFTKAALSRELQAR
ncbi:outer membrane lipoprotein-sorting protein [bacterium]|nr:outer membrane lipoprotein-sorting protein [bacterium]